MCGLVDHVPPPTGRLAVLVVAASARSATRTAILMDYFQLKNMQKRREREASSDAGNCDARLLMHACQHVCMQHVHCAFWYEHCAELPLRWSHTRIAAVGPSRPLVTTPTPQIVFAFLYLT